MITCAVYTDNHNDINTPVMIFVIVLLKYDVQIFLFIDWLKVCQMIKVNTLALSGRNYL